MLVQLGLRGLLGARLAHHCRHLRQQTLDQQGRQVKKKRVLTSTTFIKSKRKKEKRKKKKKARGQQPL